MNRTTIAAFCLFAIGGAGFLMGLSLWGWWLFTGFLVFTHD